LISVIGILAAAQGIAFAVDLVSGPDRGLSPVKVGSIALLAVGLVGFGVWIIARSLRMGISVVGGDVLIRNLFKSYSVPLNEVRNFSMGFPQARMPGGEFQAAAHLKSGVVLPINAISAGTMLGAGGRDAEAILDALNAHVRAKRANDE